MPEIDRYRLITFDVYTALFDVESSLTPVVKKVLGTNLDSLAFVRAWRRKQLEYALISNSLHQMRIPFELITRRALDDTLTRANVRPDETSRMHLVESWEDLQPWPEAPSVLEALKARGYSLALLSNGDASMLQALRKKLPGVIDHVFSSEQAGYYKPHPSVYALPLESSGLTAQEVLHVAGSPTDVLGTKAAGLSCAWSNRQHQPVLDKDYQADYEFSDLNQLREILK